MARAWARKSLDPPGSRGCEDYRYEVALLVRLRVLLKSNMPATIAETLFITNNREVALLSGSTGARQQQIAEALRAGIKDCLSTH